MSTPLKPTFTRETSHRWHWQIKRGRQWIAGGYCRRKRDARSDAAYCLNRPHLLK